MSQPAPATESSPASTGVPAWRILFRMLAGFFALFAFAYWAAAGGNKGWTKTQIPVKQVDEVTGIEFVTYQDHFMPGVELFGLALIFSLALFAVTFIRRKPKS
jgi:hypothetical protein